MRFRGCDSNKSRTTTRPIAPTPPRTTKSRLFLVVIVRFTQGGKSGKQLLLDHIQPFVELLVSDDEREEIAQGVAMGPGIDENHAILNTTLDQLHGEFLG